MKRLRLFHTLMIYALVGIPSAIGSSFFWPEMAIAQTILQEQGKLEPGDSVLNADGSLYDRYTFEGRAGQQVTITLESDEFDTYLLLVDANGNKIGESDDIDQTNSNSSLTITLPTNGTYTVVANSYDNTGRGEYRLTVSNGSNTNSTPSETPQSTPQGTPQETPQGTSEGTSQRTNSSSRTAFAGDVRAEYSAQPGSSSCIEHPKLTILRADQPVFNQELTIREFCHLGEIFRVQDLDGDRDPEVILEFFSGGAHCCSFSLIYHYDDSHKQYTSIQQPWGNVGFQLEDLNRDGIPEFESADDRFAYKFGSFAGSGFPIQIWRYRQGQLVDVTRNYRNQIYDSAYRHWQRYTEARTNVEGGRGILAAYLAEKYLLNEAEDGWNRVRTAYQGSDREQFFADLAQFLQETGYTTQ